MRGDGAGAHCDHGRRRPFIRDAPLLLVGVGRLFHRPVLDRNAAEGRDVQLAHRALGRQHPPRKAGVLGVLAVLILGKGATRHERGQVAPLQVRNVREHEPVAGLAPHVHHFVEELGRNRGALRPPASAGAKTGLELAHLPLVVGKLWGVRLLQASGFGDKGRTLLVRQPLPLRADRLVYLAGRHARVRQSVFRRRGRRVAEVRRHRPLWLGHRRNRLLEGIRRLPGGVALAGSRACSGAGAAGRLEKLGHLAAGWHAQNSRLVRHSELRRPRRASGATLDRLRLGTVAGGPPPRAGLAGWQLERHHVRGLGESDVVVNEGPVAVRHFVRHRLQLIHIHVIAVGAGNDQLSPGQQRRRRDEALVPAPVQAHQILDRHAQLCRHLARRLTVLGAVHDRGEALPRRGGHRRRPDVLGLAILERSVGTTLRAVRRVRAGQPSRDVHRGRGTKTCPLGTRSGVPSRSLLLGVSPSPP